MNIPYIQILQRLLTPIFEEIDGLYFLREQVLKTNAQKTILAIKENIEQPGIKAPNTWQKSVIKRNVEGLSNYLDKLHQELDRQKIINYVDNLNNNQINLNHENDEMILFVNSYYATIIYDIVWADNISVSDVINITQGKVNRKNLEIKFKHMVKHLKNTIIPYLKSSSLYNTKVNRLEEAVTAFNKKLYKSASIMFIPATEGLVKSLGNYLIEKQQIDISKMKKSLHSLDSFLQHIPWKNDYSIDIGKYMFITGNYIFVSDYNIEDKKMIDLKTRLNFLKRQYKDDRNSILHGDDVSFGEIWDLYVNFAALKEIFDTIKYYDGLYNQH